MLNFMKRLFQFVVPSVFSLFILQMNYLKLN